MTIRNAALPLKPSRTSKCSFPLLVRSALIAALPIVEAFIIQISPSSLVASESLSRSAEYVQWKTSTHLKTTSERSTVRRRSDKDAIIACCKIPYALRFVERLQYSWIDGNRYNLRLARCKCDS